MTQAPKSEEQKSQDKEKPSFNDKLADIALKVIMTGGVTGGGIGAFWSLFKESDVPKAIASAVIGLGISYAAKMLQPIHKGNENRLEKMAKRQTEALTAWAKLHLPNSPLPKSGIMRLKPQSARLVALKV